MMTANGLVKLIEECSELLQVASKKLAYYYTDEHPDGGKPLSKRLEEEIADVLAACEFVIEAHGLDKEHVRNRTEGKLALFRRWHGEP